MANKRISQLPYVGNTGYTSADIMPIVNYDVPTGTTKHTPIIDFQSWVLSATPITYASFVNLITNNSLIPGAFYNIVNFRTCYDQPDFDVNNNPITTGNYKQGPVEPIMVLATSINTISEVAYQSSHPFDRIRYDWTFSTTEVTNGVAFGRITERIDEFNNRTDYDHKNILFKRYKLYTYRFDLPLNGLIDIALGGVVTGTNTKFTDLSLGDVIYVDGINPSFFEVVNISNDTSMTITGDTITTGNNLSFYLGIEETNGTNGYFSYKQTNVKTNDFYEKTTFGDAILNSYAVNNYIGDYANDYQNIGSGVFLLSNNLFLEGEYVNNKIGNSSYNNTFGTDNENNVWGDYCFENVSTNDIDECIFGYYFNNNIINCNFLNNVIGDVFQSNRFLGENQTSVSNNKIGNNFNSNIIYSEFILNNILNDFTNNFIGDAFNRDIFEFSNNTIKNNFNDNRIFSNFKYNSIHNNFIKNTVYGVFESNKVGEEFFANKIDDSFKQNVIKNKFSGNAIGDNFISNSIGNKATKNLFSYNFSSNVINDGFFNNIPVKYNFFGFNDFNTISNRNYGVFNDSLEGSIDDLIVGKELIMKVEIPNRYFSIIFNQWSITNGGFQYERQEYDSAGTPIGNKILFTKTDFGSEIDVIIPGFLEITRSNTGGGIYNSAVEGSFNSLLSPSGTTWNSIYTQKGDNGSDFSYNRIGNGFESNIIGNNFGTDSVIPLGNTIGDLFQNNVISNNTYNNNIGNGFNKNVIDDNFIFNNIKNYFVNNTLGPNFQGNDIGDYFGCANEKQIIGGFFQNNHIGNYFGNDGLTDKGANLIGVVTTVGYSTLKGIPTTINLTNGGSGYSNSTGVPTTYGGTGTGLTVDITTDGFGVIISVTISNAGTYYSVGDVVTITTGGNNATITITDINTFNIGETIEDGFGGSAEVVSDNGVDEMTIDLIIGDLTIGDTIDNLSGSSAVITGYTIEPLASGFTQNNLIGNTFINNQIGTYFQNNFIRNNFGSYKTTGISNIILDKFSGNTIGNYFGFDLVDNGDGGNIIRNNFAENVIGESFTYNVTVNTSDLGYFNNVIGYGCSRNTITDGFNFNRIADIFYENTLGSYFADNEIGYFFNLNTFADFATDNRIGYFSWVNEVGTNFSSNHTNDSFYGNNIGNDFQHNTIGNFCGQPFGSGNIWGSNIFDNQIGDHTVGNQIASNFNNNNIFNDFQGNVVGLNFQYNIIQTQITGTDFSPATHVYNSYNCTLFKNSGSNNRLSYFDALDNLIIVNVNS